MRALWLGSVATTLLSSQLAFGAFTNGGFEQDWTAWSVEALKVPTHIPVFPPTTFTDLGTVPWTDPSPAVSTVVGSAVAPNTGGRLTTPLFGNKSARVGDGVASYRGASIQQTATMGVADVDPADGKVHVRFAIAPVLDAPNHPADQQPYFFVEVKNLTKGTQLFTTFNFANQTGVAWQTVGSYQFTNWQAIDIAPGAGLLDINDQVEVIIVSGGCGQGGHGALVYADSGQGLTTLPGPFVTATGPLYGVRSDLGADTPTTPPALPPAGQRTVTYNYHYTNGGDAPMTGSQVVIQAPQDQDQRDAGGTQTAHQQNLRVNPGSVPPSCSLTTTPAPHPDGSLGPIDTITCNVGTLNPGNTGDLQLQWIIPNNARGPTLNHGNYFIRSDATPPLLGPLVKTELTNAQLADLKATVTNPDASLTCGSATTYTVLLENNGSDPAPSGVSIANTLPTGLTVGSWTCDDTGNTTLTCPSAGGTDSIASATTTAWPAGDKLTYTVNATVDACSSSQSLTYPVTLTLPAGPAVDPDNTNNTGAQTINAGPSLQSLTVATAGDGLGKVTSVLPGIVCDKTTPAQCTDTKNFPNGSTVALYANAPAGSIFSGWSGAGCTGLAQPCLVTMDQARSVVANFATPLTVDITAGAGGTVTPGSGTTLPVAPGNSVSITVVPNALYAPVFGGDCPAGSYVGNTYTTDTISGNCTLDVSFTNTVGSVFTAAPNSPPGGSIVGGPKTVVSGGSATWVVVPNSGFVPTDPTNDCPGALGTWNIGRSEYTVAPINDNCNVFFGFAATHSVTGSVSVGSPGPGSILAGASQNVMNGSSAVFTLSRAGATIDLASCPAGTFDGAGTTYTVPNITTDCSVVFSFPALPASAASIPTLSEWGLIILSALMGVLTLGALRRRA